MPEIGMARRQATCRPQDRAVEFDPKETFGIARVAMAPVTLMAGPSRRRGRDSAHSQGESFVRSYGSD
jgi:hypothetical protein